MPRSRKHHKMRVRRSKSKANPHESFQLSYIENPFAGISPEVLAHTFSEIGKDKAIEFTHTLSNIQKEIRKIDPLPILSFTASYGLTVGIGQEGIRIATQVLRNWGYYDQVKHLADNIVLPLDEHFTSHHGFTATAAITVFAHMLHEWDERLNAHWNRLSGLVSATTPGGAVSAYYRAFPEIKDSDDQFIAEMRKRKVTREQTVLMLISHADLFLTRVGTFIATEIAASTELPLDVVDSILSKLSLSFGDLKDDDIEHFFMNNPVWRKPAIHLGGHACSASALVGQKGVVK